MTYEDTVFIPVDKRIIDKIRNARMKWADEQGAYPNVIIMKRGYIPFTKDTQTFFGMKIIISETLRDSDGNEIEDFVLGVVF
jgi:hypothetical protein